MNNHLEPQPKKLPLFRFLGIIVLAAGLHLLVLYPFISPKLSIPKFDNALIQKDQNAPLSIKLIYKKEPVATNASKAQVQPIKQTELAKPAKNNEQTPEQAYFHLDGPALLNQDNNSPNDNAFNLESMNPQMSHDAFNIESLKTLNDDPVAPLKEDMAPRDALDLADQNILSQSLENTQTQSFSKELANDQLNNPVLEDVFSNKTQKQIQQAAGAQQQYEEAQKDDINYAITEDSDGTRYVNIKGVCWRIPPPGTEEPWMIVYAGCAGQTKTFNLEINIGLDILGPDSPFSLE